MNILVTGTKGSNTQDYADRILAVVGTTTYAKFGKKTLIIQTDSLHPIEQVLIGKNMNFNVARDTFSFNNNGMDAIWKSIRSGQMSADDWADSCRNIARQKKNGLDIADVSSNPEFIHTVCNEFETFEELVKSADRWYDVVYIFANSNNEELLTKIRSSVINGNNMVDKEVVCVPQSPEKRMDPAPNRYFAIKNFDFDSKFTVKELGKAYGKNVFPIPYNINFKDACLEKDALHFCSVNMKDEVNDDNYQFTECISSLVSHLLGTEEKEEKVANFVFRR